jgi:GT2 family glycosyltransferase
MRNAPTLSIIIPAFNQWNYTHACLEALAKTIPSHIPHEIIVVDNASTDGTAEGLRGWQSKLPSLFVERLETNTGFSPACNRGAEISRGSYLLFLNNDTVPLLGWLEPLLEEIQQPRVGMVAPKLVTTDTRSINHAGYVFDGGVFYGIYLSRPSNFPGANKKRDYQALLGACILLRRDLFFAIGSFSLAGLEDIDLCLKIGTRGLVNRYVPQSVVIHHGSVTLKNSDPASFPATDGADFARRWLPNHVTCDDYLYYVEDEEWTAPPADRRTRAREIAKDSMELVANACRAINSQQSGAALVHAQEALALWPHNPMAYLLLCRLLAEEGRSEEVLSELARINEFSFYPVLATHLLPILSTVLPSDIVETLGLHR